MWTWHRGDKHEPWDVSSPKPPSDTPAAVQALSHGAGWVPGVTSATSCSRNSRALLSAPSPPPQTHSHGAEPPPTPLGIVPRAPSWPQHPKIPPWDRARPTPSKTNGGASASQLRGVGPQWGLLRSEEVKKKEKREEKKGEWVEIITSTVRPRVAAGQSPSGRGSHAAATPNASSLTPEGGIGAGGEALGAQIGTFLRGRKPRGGEQTKAEQRDLDAAPRVTAPAGSGCRRPPGTTPGGCSPPVRPRSVHTGGNPVPVPLSEPPLLPGASRRGFSFKQIGKKQRKWGGKGNVSAARCYGTDPGGPRGWEGPRRPLAGMGAPGRAPVPPQPGHRGQERGVGSAYRGLKKEPGPPAG